MRFGKIAKLCVEEVAIFLRRYVPASHVVDSAEDRECRKRLNGLHFPFVGQSGGTLCVA
jgi:hypothetical protein